MLSLARRRPAGDHRSAGHRTVLASGFSRRPLSTIPFAEKTPRWAASRLFRPRDFGQWLGTLDDSRVGQRIGKRASQPSVKEMNLIPKQYPRGDPHPLSRSKMMKGRLTGGRDDPNFRSPVPEHPLGGLRHAVFG